MLFFIQAVSLDAVIQMGDMMMNTFGEVFEQSTDAVFGIDTAGVLKCCVEPI